MGMLSRIIGPRVPPEDIERHALRYAAPSVLLLAARLLLLVSLFLPYWHMELIAPQYPDNLHLTAFVNNLAGDVAEINGLNHYIGMRPLEDAARFERRYGVYALIAMAVMLEFAGWIHRRWAVLLVVPAMLFPVVFLLDLHLWMSHFGQNLDPNAPLSNAIDPFVPPILGTGVVGQFKTTARPGAGLWSAAASSVTMLMALYFHRRTYKPLIDRTARAGKGSGD